MAVTTPPIIPDAISTEELSAIYQSRLAAMAPAELEAEVASALPKGAVPVWAMRAGALGVAGYMLHGVFKAIVNDPVAMQKLGFGVLPPGRTQPCPTPAPAPKLPNQQGQPDPTHWELDDSGNLVEVNSRTGERTGNKRKKPPGTRWVWSGSKGGWVLVYADGADKGKIVPNSPVIESPKPTPKPPSVWGTDTFGS